MDLVQENIKKLKEIFPEAFVEGEVDFDVLRQIFGGGVDTSKERYSLNWNGKSEARQRAQEVSTGTLRPAKEESKNWDNTENIYIEGDNLEVLKLLQKSYHGKIKMIYIDPPYNTGSDFIYNDDFSQSEEEYKEISGNYDEEGNRAVLGGQIGKTGYPSYGILSGLLLNFDHNDNEIIELEDSGKGLGVEIDVSNAKTLPEEAKLTPPIKGTDDNIDALVKDGQLKNVIKSDGGSPKAKINYNLEIERGEYWKYK